MTLPSARAMVPQDITRIVWVSDPQISSDGARVAFVATTLSEERDEYLSSIWVVDADGRGAPRRFTAGPKRDRDPRWSPDGTRLAFVSEREGKKKGQLYVMPADGGEPTRLTDERHGVADPVWSPDGSRLAFVARVGGYHAPEGEEDSRSPARLESSRRSSTGGTARASPTIAGATSSSWRPRAAPCASSPTATGTTRTPRGRPTGGSSPSARPAMRTAISTTAGTSGWWTPTGERRSGSPTPLGPAVLPAFSPDGRAVAYLGRRSVNEYGRNVRVFTVATGGGAPRCLTPGLDRSCAPLSTRPHLVAGRAVDHLRRRGPGALGIYRVGDGRRRGAGADRRRRARGDRVLALRETAAASPSRPPIPSRRPRCFVASGDGGGRAPAHGHEPRLARRGGARAARALPPRARGLLGRRLGDEAPRVPPGRRVAGAAQYPRRSPRPVQPRLLRRVPGLRGRGLRGDLREPARQPGLRRGVHARGDRRLGRRRLRRRHGGARRGRSPATPGSTRRGSA